MVSSAERKFGIPGAVWLLLLSGAILGCVGDIGGGGSSGSRMSGGGGAAGGGNVGGLGGASGASGGASGGGGLGVPPTTCDGTPLAGDNSGRPACPPPVPPTQNCDTPRAKITRAQMFQTPPLEAEVMSAVDPRAGSQLVYIATTEATTQSGTGPTGTCITSKRIRVYASSDLGVNWAGMGGRPS